MNELELRVRVQAMIQQYIESLMQNDGVTATIVEDALNKTLINIKDKAMQEFLISVSQPAETPIKQQSEGINGNEGTD